jgi:hypothetical protein
LGGNLQEYWIWPDFRSEAEVNVRDFEFRLLSENGGDCQQAEQRGWKS